MSNADQKPIAVCKANELEAYFFPFYLKPATEFEPPFLFLEDHVINFGVLEIEGVGDLVKISSDEDLRKNGFHPSEDGIYYV